MVVVHIGNFDRLTQKILRYSKFEKVIAMLLQFAHGHTYIYNEANKVLHG